MLEIGHQLARGGIEAFSVLFAACDRDVWKEVMYPWQVTIVTHDFDEPIDAASTVRLLLGKCLGLWNTSDIEVL